MGGRRRRRGEEGKRGRRRKGEERECDGEESGRQGATVNSVKGGRRGRRRGFDSLLGF